MAGICQCKPFPVLTNPNLCNVALKSCKYVLIHFEISHNQYKGIVAYMKVQKIIGSQLALRAQKYLLEVVLKFFSHCLKTPCNELCVVYLRQSGSYQK